MNSAPLLLSRRDALAVGVKGLIVASLAGPFAAESETPPAPSATEFVPENDYPFFGGELPAAYAFDSATDQVTTPRA